MSLPLYFDHNMPVPIAVALRERGIDVLTAREDGGDRQPDEALFERAEKLKRVMVSQDTDFLQIADSWLSAGQTFSGLIHCRISGVSTSDLIDDLELVALGIDSDEAVNQILWVPF